MFFLSLSPTTDEEVLWWLWLWWVAFPPWLLRNTTQEDKEENIEVLLLGHYLLRCNKMVCVCVCV